MRLFTLVLFAFALLAGSAAAHPGTPRVAYATYWGGAGGEGCEPVRGEDGSLYVTCGTDSTNLPRVHALQGPQGQEDGYVAKLDRSGRHIIYATYLGGPGQDEIDASVVDRQGHLIITGFAANGFPTTRGAFDRSFNGAQDCCDGLFGDAFVAELSADGRRLLFSTFIGGAAADRASVLALAPDGSITITGFTGSTDFPTTRGAAQRQWGGGNGEFEDVASDGFAARLDPSGSRLLYSTYLGGANDDVGSAVTVDDAGDAYVTGFTASDDYPTTRRALKTANEPDVTDAVVSKLDRNGRLVWSTYLGGAGYDFGFGVDVDDHRNVYVSGSTSGEFPVTPGAAQHEYGDNFDWFVARLDRSGSSLGWATYLGGSDFDGFTPTLAVDRTNHVDVVGATASTDFPTTRDAIQPANAGGLDVGIARFDRDGRLLFSSYYGGSGDDDNGGSVPFVDPDGTLFLGGATGSDDYPVTSGAAQTTYGGGEIDGHVTAIDFGRH